MDKYKLAVSVGINTANKIFSKKIPVDLYLGAGGDLDVVYQNSCSAAIYSLFNSAADAVAKTSTEGTHKVKADLVIEIGADLIISPCTLFVGVYLDNTGIIEEVETEPQLRQKVHAKLKEAAETLMIQYGK